MRKIILFVLTGCIVSSVSAQITTDALLDTIQHTAFKYFWEAANPSNGLIKDRLLAGAPCSIASEGFGLTAICIGVDHGWVSRAAARDRVLTALKTFWYLPQGGGVNGYIGNFGLFYHMLDMNTGTRTWTSELSTIDTALLLAGIIDVKQYFTGSDSLETLIRHYSDSIYYRMDWNLMRNFNPGILMGWLPESGFANFGQWVGYNEASLMYIFAMGSPTHPVDSTAWLKWTEGYNANYKSQYGYLYVNFPPLFGHQYSHCWIDFRNVADDWMRAHNLDYFENSRRATLAQRAYSIANPGKFAGYSDSLWGITASDSPYGYKARGAPPAQDDDGTIAPTAPVSSIAFAPEVVIPVIYKMWNTYGSKLWTPYGFRDAFNLTLDWWDNDIIGIDQGPMIIMIENYRTQSVWKRFMKNPDVQRGMAVAKCSVITGVEKEKSVPQKFSLSQNYPNPFNPSTLISYELPKNTFVRLTVYDILGNEVSRPVEGVQAAGRHGILFNAAHLSSGIYFYTIRTADFTETKKMILLQ